jgi:hypothetical protein
LMNLDRLLVLKKKIVNNSKTQQFLLGFFVSNSTKIL